MGYTPTKPTPLSPSGYADVTQKASALPTKTKHLPLFRIPPILLALTLAFAITDSAHGKPPEPNISSAKNATNKNSVFASDNIVAWCIVPFDAKKRGPEERAQMLERLGIKRLAYDYRREHIPTFDAEVEAMKRHGIELTAWWFPGALNDEANGILSVIKRHKITPQLWLTGKGATPKTPAEQMKRVEQEAARIRPIAEAAAKLGCKVALYNHGGWFGEPENQIRIIEKMGLPNVGIVYNFHHGHAHIEHFPELWKKMQPHLFAVNLCGMELGADTRGRKILNLSEGDRELGMMRVIAASGWSGPVGILDHRRKLDSEVGLRDNLLGLEWVKKEITQPGSGGKRPKLESALPQSNSAAARPLNPAAHQLANHPINRDRIYDFYAKQARGYNTANKKPKILPAFPGLDGGRFGHWGNQDETTWKSNRWNQMDPGSLQAGVFRKGKRTIPRGVCVRLGESAACFDPETLTWPEAWSGEFVRFGTARFGFMSGINPAGKPIAIPNREPAKAGSFTYRGFYRHGAQTTFAYERNGEEWLEAAVVKNKEIAIKRERSGEGALSELTHGGPAQWPQIFKTSGTLGTAKPYAIDTLTPPKKTPWNSLWHIGGLDFFPNGDAAICTFEGEVWIVSGIDAKLTHLKWKRFAAGLHQPLGLNIVNGKVCVLGRDQITRLHDLNDDGEADFYECFANAYQTPTGGHDYVTGMQHDAQGRFYLASGKQGLVRVSPGKGISEVLATGLRNPNGVGLGPNGEVAVAVQEGDWTPASMLYEFLPDPQKPAGHYGHNGPKPGPLGHLPPLAYLPRGVDHSSGGQCYVQGDRWGVPAGSLVHLSWGNGTAFIILREQIGKIAQGSVIPLPGDFSAGANRGAFNPHDGQFYVAGMTGWVTYAPDEGSLQRMRYTGEPVHTPRATEVYQNGVLLRFAQPLDKNTAADTNRYFAQQWNYRYSAAYGSDEYSIRSPHKRGHDPLSITSAHLLEDGHAIFLEIPQLQPANILHLQCEIPDLLTRDFYLTLHKLGPAFTQFPGYRAITKLPLPTHAEHKMSAMPKATSARPVKWEKGPSGRKLHIQAASGMQFAQKELHAKAGERLSLVFENPDAMPHNWVLVKIGGVKRVGELANRLITESDAVARSYVPESPDVLAHTRILNPKKKTTIHFTAPANPGRYPYICTFPGHWMLMRGELIVE